VKLSDIGADMLVKREGVVLKPYNDSRGHCTVGIGHLIHRGNCTPADRQQWGTMTRQQAIDLFRQDVVQYELPVNEVKVPLSQNQFDALVSFTYNVGVNGFRSSTVLKRLNAGDYEGAATALMLWNKPPEIVGRRRGEMNQFRTPYGSQVPAAPGLQRGPSSKFAKAEWLHPEFKQRLERVYDEAPFTNKSGGRSRQRQAELYRLFKAGKGNPANAPGTSWHEYDEDGSTLAQAADIHPKDGNWTRLHAAGKRHGIHFPVAKEPWHAQPLEAKSSSRQPGQGLGPVSQYYSPGTPLLTDEEEDMFIFGISSPDPAEGGVWLLAGDGRAHHVPKPEDLEAMKRAGIKDVGPMSRDFLLRFERVHPSLSGSMP
jgi:GH24 family phage-related lysozyme (muramidase)